MTLKALISGLLLLLTPGASLAAGADSSPALWARFKADFISQDGRVIDFFQNRTSHSEGQGYAMLIAQAHGDRAAFDLCWNWAVNNLQVRGKDKLFAWSWGRNDQGQWAVLDLNNAVDGDVLIAWALVKAAKRWPGGDYSAKAGEVLDNLLDSMLVGQGGLSFLLPGQKGFSLADGRVVLNPSYFIFPAYRDFAKIHNAPIWNRLYDDAKTLLSRSLFGKYRLPADWVVFNNHALSIYTEKSEAFGFDAVRTPLYLAWDNDLAALPGLGGYLDFMAKLGYPPDGFNLVHDQASLHPGPAGFYAVFALAAAGLDRTDQSRTLGAEAAGRAEGEKENYYSAVLRLLTLTELDK